MAKRSSGVRVLRSQVVYRGPVFYVTSDMVREPAGVKVQRDIVRHAGSVVIMAVEGDAGREPRLLLARQYRYAADARLWELPAGRIDAGESELAAARRELAEETGFTAKRWRRALKFFASPGFLDETHALWMASDLRRGPAAPEEDEVIALRFVWLSAALRMVERGRIRDGKTIAGILWLARQTARRSAGKRR